MCLVLCTLICLFPTVFQTYEMHCRRFHSKKFSRHFQLQNLLLIRLISNCTLCCTFQGVVLLVISHRPHALCLSNFGITRASTPWIVLLVVPIIITSHKVNSELFFLSHSQKWRKVCKESFQVSSLFSDLPVPQDYPFNWLTYNVK